MKKPGRGKASSKEEEEMAGLAAVAKDQPPKGSTCRGKRVKAPPSKEEPEFFPEKRNLVRFSCLDFPEGDEMQSLQVLVLPHEAAERAGPPLADDVDPFEVDPAELDLGQGDGLGLLQPPVLIRHDEVDEGAAVGVDEGALDGRNAGGPARRRHWETETEGERVGVAEAEGEGCEGICCVGVKEDGITQSISVQGNQCLHLTSVLTDPSQISCSWPSIDFYNLRSFTL